MPLSITNTEARRYVPAWITPGDALKSCMSVQHGLKGQNVSTIAEESQLPGVLADVRPNIYHEVDAVRREQA